MWKAFRSESFFIMCIKISASVCVCTFLIPFTVMINGCWLSWSANRCHVITSCLSSVRVRHFCGRFFFLLLLFAFIPHWHILFCIFASPSSSVFWTWNKERIALNVPWHKKLFCCWGSYASILCLVILPDVESVHDTGLLLGWFSCASQKTLLLLL